MLSGAEPKPLRRARQWQGIARVPCFHITGALLALCSCSLALASGGGAGGEAGGGAGDGKALPAADTSASCAAWASQGECASNAEYMLGACATSCSNAPIEEVQHQPPPDEAGIAAAAEAALKVRVLGLGRAAAEQHRESCRVHVHTGAKASKFVSRYSTTFLLLT